MSRKSERERIAREAAAREDAEMRMRIFELDERMEARREQDRRDHRQLVADIRQRFAQDHLDAAAEELGEYRVRAVREALRSGDVAPQFGSFITGSSKEEIDAAVERARAATAEILAELSGQSRTTAFQQAATDAATRGPGREADMQQRLTAAQQATVLHGAPREEPSEAQRGIDRIAAPADPRLPQGMTADELAKAMDKSMSMDEYLQLRSRLGLGHRDGGIFG
jgi:hypothetical protein